MNTKAGLEEFRELVVQQLVHFSRHIEDSQSYAPYAAKIVMAAKKLPAQPKKEDLNG